MEPDQPAPVAEPAQRPPWLEKLYEEMGGSGYQLTDDDLALLSQYMLMQQFMGGMGQLDLARGQLDYQNRVLDLNEEQLGQQYAEFEFMRDQYFPWYTGDYFDFMQQQAENQLAMSDNQKTISDNQVIMSENDIDKSLNYGLAQKFQTEQAKYGADAARYQFLVQIGAAEDPRARQGGGGLSSYARSAYGY